MSNRTEEPMGTFACPYCGRDYPHSELQHQGDREWLLGLLRDARHYAQLFVARHHLDQNSEAQLFIRRVMAAANQISRNADSALAGRLCDIGAGLGSYADELLGHVEVARE